LGAQNDPEDLLGTLARLVGEGQPWALDVERWRNENPGRALTEGHRRILRKERAKLAEAPAETARPRKALSAADEADVQAIVEAYVASYRRVIAAPGFVALSSHFADAKAILDDARRLAERARRGDWRPTPAGVVTHRLESYLRDSSNKRDGFRLRWIFDRTEQDDLPRPPAKSAPRATMPDGPIGARPRPVFEPTPPPDMATLANALGVDEAALRPRRPVPKPPPPDVTDEYTEFAKSADSARK